MHIYLLLWVWGHSESPLLCSNSDLKYRQHFFSEFLWLGTKSETNTARSVHTREEKTHEPLLCFSLSKLQSDQASPVLGQLVLPKLFLFANYDSKEKKNVGNVVMNVSVKNFGNSIRPKIRKCSVYVNFWLGTQCHISLFTFDAFALQQVKNKKKSDPQSLRILHKTSNLNSVPFHGFKTWNVVLSIKPYWKSVTYFLIHS